MRLFRFALFAAVVLTAAQAFADVPGILLVQIREPYPGDFDSNLNVPTILAESFDNDGRLAPIAWDITDPKFRLAVTQGIIKDPGAKLDLEAAQAARIALKCDYLMVVHAVRREGMILSQAYVYKGPRLVWKDPVDVDKKQLDMLRKLQKSGGITQEAYDLAILKASSRMMAVQSGPLRSDTDTARSISNTWIQLLDADVFKGLPQKPKVETPTLAPGQNTNIAAPQAPAVVDNTEVLKTAATLLKQNKTPFAAINFVRDAVDAEPLDVERRLMLIKLLNQVQMPILAAGEARRAAEVLPDKVTLRVAAARAWLLAGKPDEAQVDINEAIAREPDNIDTRLLLADLCLLKNDAKMALEHINVAIAKAPTGDVYYKRALTLAILGDEKGSAADMAKATELGLSAEPADASARYSQASEMIGASVSGSAAELRSLFQRAVVKRKDPEVRALVEAQASMAKARGEFMESLVPPPGNKGSQEKRVLALKLLQQSLAELRSYLENGDEDTLADARINFGEALKGMNAAHDAFVAESKPPNSPDVRSGTPEHNLP